MGHPMDTNHGNPPLSRSSSARLFYFSASSNLDTPVVPVRLEFSTLSFVLNGIKNNKNKTASAAPSPAQTPRTSMQATRPTAEQKMTKEQAMEKITNNSTAPSLNWNLVI
ncbi:hypothetical protein BGW42_005939 [Actinomortierella wolfii]|nr:hypothetical protein BGW42_005939 [Actinomortierella wolfii]